jgi:16S rRNA (guanine(966)-N(2))-methyltransferase RsmD
MMRIITGKARGYRLETLPGEDTTRPTTERVKESIFSILQFEIEGRAVLDLFAGSGQMGLEALSRGAASAVFVDSSKDACEIVKRNARGAKLDGAMRIANIDAHAFCQRTSERFDLAFLDPPYRAQLLPALLPQVAALVKDGGAVVCETDTDTKLPESVESLVLEKEKRYGKTQVWIYRKKEAIE